MVQNIVDLLDPLDLLINNRINILYSIEINLYNKKLYLWAWEFFPQRNLSSYFKFSHSHRIYGQYYYKLQLMPAHQLPFHTTTYSSSNSFRVQNVAINVGE